MTKPKRITESALAKKRDAFHHRLKAEDKGASSYIDLNFAAYDDAAAEAMVVRDKQPEIYMGEVAKSDLPGVNERYWLQDTLLSGNRIHEEASVCRTDMLVTNNLDIAALAIDAADSVKADNSMEKMLAHQMALAHSMAMRIGNAAMGEVQKIQHPTTFGNGLKPGAATELQRLTNSMSRLMATYQQGMMTLQRLKTGGNQVVTVQHVNVEPGGQAVIGNVQTGGGRPPGGGSGNG
jgi:hypothetical protein